MEREDTYFWFKSDCRLLSSWYVMQGSLLLIQFGGNIPPKKVAAAIFYSSARNTIRTEHLFWSSHSNLVQPKSMWSIVLQQDLLNIPYPVGWGHFNCLRVRNVMQCCWLLGRFFLMNWEVVVLQGKSPLMKHCSTTTVKPSVPNGLRTLYEPESGECCAMLWNESWEFFPDESGGSSSPRKYSPYDLKLCGIFLLLLSWPRSLLSRWCFRAIIA